MTLQTKPVVAECKGGFLRSKQQTLALCATSVCAMTTQLVATIYVTIQVVPVSSPYPHPYASWLCQNKTNKKFLSCAGLHFLDFTSSSVYQRQGRDPLSSPLGTWK